jgi:hypothetical protein
MFQSAVRLFREESAEHVQSIRDSLQLQLREQELSLFCRSLLNNIKQNTAQTADVV